MKVFRNIEDTKVVLINTDYGKYILKVFSPKVKILNAFQIVSKRRLLRKAFHQTDRVRREGFTALNDFTCWRKLKHYAM
ncbi:lipopolysaccharide core heptose(II) kinase RfaY [Salmonella enterica]|uniref:lipopolysaccharide core heptose(II) kinase RfaY n=1 Tax=Salmonella enterica TaxID=28901 RepID=UPI003D2FA475